MNLARIFTIAALLACLPVHAAPQSAGSEDIAVLSSILRDRCAYAKKHPDHKYSILSSDAPAIDGDLSADGLDPVARESLLRRNNVSHRLPALQLCPAYKFAQQQKIDYAMQRKKDASVGGWGGFYKVFPNADGVSYLSLPGYSGDGLLAIVQFSGACGPLCGSGSYWVLKKVKGTWIVVKSSPGWVS